VREGIDARQSAVRQAEAIIESQVGSSALDETREMVPLIRQLRESAEDARRREVERRGADASSEATIQKQCLKHFQNGLTK